MDSEFWTSRLAAAKRRFNLHNHNNNLQAASQFDRLLNIDEFEVEDDGIRPDISCPYCYEEFDIASLCTHLEDDHSFDSKPTVCPICSLKVARDMLSHITLQHGNLFKFQRRRRLRRAAIPNSQAFSLFGRDLREAHLQVLLGGGVAGSGGFRSTDLSTASNSVAATDPFLSSLVLNFPGTETDDISKSLASATEFGHSSLTKSSASSHAWRPKFDSSLSYEERERRVKQATGRAGFMQDLVLCTFLGE